ncbi:MAG: glycosyltransferase family 2 protein [Bacteriovoracaceae bacterium]|nr:glycosyltransferase family 2 protein [Bacteriovoracaceae bacterium]
MQKITAIIPTFNEEIHIKAAIESVLWCDEIIVVDSFSTDKTVEIAKSFSQVKLLQRDYQYSASQKNWTIPQAKHEWIFLLDADEIPTPKLVEEIKTILKTGTPHAGFWVYRNTHFMGKAIKFSGWQSDRVIRLFKRDECRYQDLKVHAEIESKGEISKLKNKLIHYTYKDFSSYLKKADRYTNWGAMDRFTKMQKKNQKIGVFEIITKPVFRFLRHYVLKLGVLDGIHGFVVSSLGAYNVFIRTVKIWRLQNGETLTDPFNK